MNRYYFKMAIKNFLKIILILYEYQVMFNYLVGNCLKINEKLSYSNMSRCWTSDTRSFSLKMKKSLVRTVFTNVRFFPSRFMRFLWDYFCFFKCQCFFRWFIFCKTTYEIFAWKVFFIMSILYNKYILKKNSIDPMKSLK